MRLRSLLMADPRVSPSPHHGARRWLMLRTADIDNDELRELLASAYRQVAR